MAKGKMHIDDLTLRGKALDDMYRKYLSSYGNKSKILRNDYGIAMWDKKYSKEEFSAMYEATARTMIAEKGWTKIKDTVVIKAMVDRQATEMSEAQAKAFQKGMREQGKYMTLTEIYKTAPEQIRELYEQMTEDGIDVYERKAIISSAFFGSPA